MTHALTTVEGKLGRAVHELLAVLYCQKSLRHVLAQSIPPIIKPVLEYENAQAYCRSFPVGRFVIVPHVSVAASKTKPFVWH